MNLRLRLSLASSLAVLLMAGHIFAADTIRWGNGWWFGSSATTTLQTPGVCEAHIIVPQRNMAISEVWLLTLGGQLGEPVFHVGIQGNSPTDFPDGEWVGGSENYGISSLSAPDQWNKISLPEEAQLLAGEAYHIVVQVVSADASNRSSLRFLNQSALPVSFRPESGVYDPRVGRENRTAAGVWSRSNSLGMLAVDTDIPAAIGQPYSGGIARTISGTTRQGQIFTLKAPSKFDRFYLTRLGMRVASTGNAEDDCYVKLLRVSDGAVLYSEKLLNKSEVYNYTSPLPMTEVTEPDPPILRSGEQYIIYVESPETTAANKYTISAIRAVDFATPMAGKDEAKFQGTNSYNVSSNNGVTWSKYNYSLSEVDVAFELELEPVPGATMILLR